MPEASLLIRTLRLGCYGDDCYGAKRSVLRCLDQQLGGTRLKTLEGKPLAVRRTFGPYFAIQVNRARKQLAHKQTGTVDQAFWHTLVTKGYPDAFAIALMNRYIDTRPKPKPPLVEPVQGFESLHKSLWEAYSEGRRRGFRDGPGTASGTYADKPGDHGFWPSYAFDLDIVQHTGWNNLHARDYFMWLTKRPEVNYAILGSRIWSRTNGLQTYWRGDHDNHVHCSAVH